MKQIPIQQDNVTALSADDFNQIPRELENVIQVSGQTLDGGDLNQINKSVSGHVAAADYYLAGGPVNAMILSAANSFFLPTEYFKGMRVRFKPNNTNTATGVTMAVVALGVVPLHLGQLPNGGTPSVPIGALPEDAIAEAVYDETPDTLTKYFRLVSVATRDATGTKTAERTPLGDTYEDSGDGSVMEIGAGFGTLPAARYESGDSGKIIIWDKDGAEVRNPAGSAYQLKTSNNGRGISFIGGPGLDVGNMRAARFNISSLTYSPVTGGYVSADSVVLTGLPYAAARFYMAFVVFTASGNEYVYPAHVTIRDDGGGVAELISTRVNAAVAPDVGSASDQRLILWYNATAVD